MENRIDFSGIEHKLDMALTSPEYALLVERFKAAKKIFIIGNGGLHFVGSHGATDMTRLIPGKAVYSFDSVGFITSNVNDHGGDNLFLRWLECTILGIERPLETLVIGTSCSGNSTNIITALTWAHYNAFRTFLISGMPSVSLPGEIDEVTFGSSSFHMAEVLTLMLFYDLIEKTGNHCPTIEEENKRKGFI